MLGLIAISALVETVVQKPESSLADGSTILIPCGETFRGPISGIAYEVFRTFPEEGLVYKDQNGNIHYNKQELLDAEAAECSIDVNLLKLDTALRGMIEGSDSSQIVPVIISFIDQPAYDISMEVRAAYDPQFEEILEPAREITERIKPLLGIEKEYLSRNISEIIDIERALLSEREKVLLEEVGRDLEQAVSHMRKQILARCETVVDAIQQPIIEKLEANGCRVKHTGKIYNSITADVPAYYLEELSLVPSVAKIWHDQIMGGMLDVSPYAILATTWWHNGYDGGIWDAAIIDSGIDSSHPSLSVDSAQTFHTTAVSDPHYNDSTLTTDDLQGHGTHIAGIIASTDTLYPGIAYGIDSLINAKAGWLGTDGRAWMYWSDAMAAIEWAILGAADDADVISLSYGGFPGATGDTGMCHFMDAVVSCLNTPVVISAGNSGPVAGTVYEPGSAYNVITVGNVDDNNTIERSDDLLRDSSSRGPTGDGRLKPDITAPGTSIMSCNSDWESLPDFVSATGTSMAAPHIAGSILLILDNGSGPSEIQLSAKGIKALLLNTAEDKGSDGPDKDYGLGYVDLSHAYFHRNDVQLGSLRDLPEGQVEKFYAGPIHLGDTATLVWDRHVVYDGTSYPTEYIDPSDLDLSIYNQENNDLIDYSCSKVNNVEQVESDAEYSSVILKIEPFMTYPPDIDEESYALATEEGFIEVNPPILSTSLSMPVSVLSGEYFLVEASVVNKGDIRAHDVVVTLELPPEFTITQGENPQNVGAVDPGLLEYISWIVRAPFSSVGHYPISAESKSFSYEETYDASNTSDIEVSVPINDIDNIKLSPLSPAQMDFGNYVAVTFDYTTNDPGGVRLFVRPYTDGSTIPDYGASGSPLYPAYAGSGNAWFTIYADPVEVDQLRFIMSNADQSLTYLDFFIDVSYLYGFVNYDLTITSTTGGSVTEPGEGTFNFPASTVVDLLAVANAGYEFDIWSGDVGTIGDPVPDTTITMDDDYSITANFAYAGDTLVYIEPPTQTVSEGTFTVDVAVDPAVDIAGVQFDLSFDPSLICAVSVAEGNLLNQGGASTLFNDGTIDCVTGTITDVYGYITEAATVSSPGVFATITFTTVAPCAAGTSSLGLSNVIVGDATATPVPITVTDGSVTVQCAPWDVNGDGCVNILDGILVGQHWGQSGAPGWIPEDVNGDGLVNILDGICVGQHWGEGCGAAAATGTASSSGAAVPSNQETSVAISPHSPHHRFRPARRPSVGPLSSVYAIDVTHPASGQPAFLMPAGKAPQVSHFADEKPT